MHGRAVPPAGHDLLDEFAGALAAWRWDVALLQEVPPWWAAPLADRLGGDRRLVLTSRNFGLPVRRALAARWPDLLRSSGGGANAIVTRRGRIEEHRALRLCRWPERRWLHAVRLRLSDDPDAREAWVGNLHLTVHDAPAARREARVAAAAMRAWGTGQPLVLGGDFNLRGLVLDGYACAASHDADYVFVRGARPDADGAALERGRLSDHAPVSSTVSLAG